MASFLHYWSPEWRSAFYASYGEIWFSQGARQAVSLTSTLVNQGAANSPPSYLTNPFGYANSAALRDTYQVVTGASLIWSPVKDLDIGVEGQYIKTGVKNGRVFDANRGGNPFTVSSEDVYQARSASSATSKKRPPHDSSPVPADGRDIDDKPPSPGLTAGFFAFRRSARQPVSTPSRRTAFKSPRRRVSFAGPCIRAPATRAGTRGRCPCPCLRFPCSAPGSAGSPGCRRSS